MGVKQLTSYVHQHYNILFKDEINLRNTTLLFDGDSLYYGLLKRVPKIYGGNYDQLYRHFANFFGLLSYLKITVYVVLDGGCNLDRKLDTICARLDQTINGLRIFDDECDLPRPLFSKRIFINVLQDLNIRYVVARK